MIKYATGDRKAGGRRFTIVELLVVMGIIMILASMLLPALEKARERAHKARWTAHSASLRADDKLMVYYNFITDDEGAMTISNQTAASGISKFQVKWGDADKTFGQATGIHSGFGRWGKKGVFFTTAWQSTYQASKLKWRADQAGATSNPITVMWWQYVDTNGGTSHNAFSIGGDSGGRIGGHAPHGNGNIYWDYGGIGANQRTEAGLNYLPYMRQWVQIAYVSEGNGGTFRGIYVNGKLYTSASVSDGPDLVKVGLNLGHMQDTASGFNGFIDEFALYQRALSADEIRAQYVNGK